MHKSWTFQHGNDLKSTALIVMEYLDVNKIKILVYLEQIPD